MRDRVGAKLDFGTRRMAVREKLKKNRRKGKEEGG